MITKYVAVDLEGRLSSDDTLEAVKRWMNENNPESGDCVVWSKSYDPPTSTLKSLKESAVVAVRKNGIWINL